MTAKASFIECSVPPVVSDEFGNNLQPVKEKEKKNIPWARVVRGDAENEMPLTPPSDEPVKEEVMSLLDKQMDADTGNAGSPRKSAWNKPSTGVVGDAPVIGGVTFWPALSESSRSVAKSTSDSLTKPVAAGDQPVSNSKEPLVSNLPPNQANANASSNSNTAPNNKAASRNRWNKRTGIHTGRNLHNNFGRPLPPPPPPFPCFELPYVPYSPMVDNPRFPVDQSSRKANFVPHPHGDSSHHDQDRNWTAAQSSIVRDSHGGHPLVPPRGFMLPPPPPLPMGPYGTPIGFDATSPLLYYPPFPFYGPPPPPPLAPLHVLHPVPDPSLVSSLVSQIDYYFSEANLVKDYYLRSNMDDHGWVPITLLAGFNRVKKLTSDINLIVDSLRSSIVVEVQDGKVRRCDDWKRWISNNNRIDERGDGSVLTEEMATQLNLEVELSSSST